MLHLKICDEAQVGGTLKYVCQYGAALPSIRVSSLVHRWANLIMCLRHRPTTKLTLLWGMRRTFHATSQKVIEGSKHKCNSNCHVTGLPTVHDGDVWLSYMNVFTKIAFIPVWWCLTHSLLRSAHSTYEAVLDPTNKVRQVMRVILPSVKSRQLTSGSFPYLIHNKAVWSSGTRQLIFCLQMRSVAQYQFQTLCQELRAIMFLSNIKHLAILLPNHSPA